MDLSTLFTDKNPSINVGEMNIQSNSALVIRFPASKISPAELDDILPRWRHLFPQKWKRRVIIHGRQFWLPG